MQIKCSSVAQPQSKQTPHVSITKRMRIFCVFLRCRALFFFFFCCVDSHTFHVHARARPHIHDVPVIHLSVWCDWQSSRLTEIASGNFFSVYHFGFDVIPCHKNGKSGEILKYHIQPQPRFQVTHICNRIRSSWFLCKTIFMEGNVVPKVNSLSPSDLHAVA